MNALMLRVTLFTFTFILSLGFQTLEAQSHPCNEAGVAGCDDPVCEDYICNIYPLCCTVEWDAICAAEAAELCAHVCGRHNTKITVCHVPDNNPDKCHSICISPSALADHLAHGDFLGECTDDCTSVVKGSCCEIHNTAGCNDAACEAAVCALDGFCCNVGWDGICVTLAVENCGDLCPPPPPEISNCCLVQNAAGCDNVDCETTVCSTDRFCCDVGWDACCQALAILLCGDLCPPDIVSDCQPLPPELVQYNDRPENEAISSSLPKTVTHSGDIQRQNALAKRIAERYLVLYPNPVRSEAYFEFSWPRDAGVSIQLFDVRGSLVKTLYTGFISKDAPLPLTTDVRHYEPGLYVVKVTLDSGRILHRKLVVQN